MAGRTRRDISSRRRRSPAYTATFDAALDAMDADQLRTTIRELIPVLDDATRTVLESSVVDRATRSVVGWSPISPGNARVQEIEAFAATARSVHFAEPSEVDDCLRDGNRAFLARDYVAAYRIFRALLLPLGRADFHIGQDEMIDELLGAGVPTCASQYVVSMYMTASPTNRARAVLAAIAEVESVSVFIDPLREMERVAIEPLPGFDEFLVQWQALVQSRFDAAKPSPWERQEDRWLREVVLRTGGPDALGEVARRSGRFDDLVAWCRFLLDAKDWKAARAAYEEAAGLVGARDYGRGTLLDGAALAAQQLGSDDLDSALERAWREAPSLARLCRWLGRSAGPEELAEKTAASLERVPPEAGRQRALIHLLRREFDAAAALLSRARGLGWSDAEHPGHLVFPCFVALLTGTVNAPALSREIMDPDAALDLIRPAVDTPGVDVLLRIARLERVDDNAVRERMLASLRTAAENRVRDVTGNQRRRHYDHAASLAAQCAHADGSPAGGAWLRALAHAYRGYPAMARAFQEAEA